MDNPAVLEILKRHLSQTESQASDLYTKLLKNTIKKLEEGGYTKNTEQLIIDLQSLGFGDLALRIRRSQFI